MKTGRKILLFFSIILCTVIMGHCLFPVQASEVKKDAVKGRVLFISSYSYGWNTVQPQIEGIKAGIEEGVTIDYEFMDTKRVNDETSMQLFYDGLAYRLSKVEPYDVVIVGDDAALIFAAEHQEELFPGTPIVFEGVNDEELARELSQNPLITGIIEKLSVEKNIEFGLSLNPKTKKVVAVLDDSITGQAEREKFYSYAEKFPELELTEINVSALSSRELRMEIGNVSTNSILIYIVMTEDADGKQYADSEAISLLVDNARVPVMRMVDSGIGTGILGGNVVSMFKSGEEAAQLAMDMIRGGEAGIGKVLESPNVYCVDANVMEQFELDMEALPEGTEIINYKPTFWERNQEAIVPAGILTLILVSVIGIFYYDNVRRRKLMGELEEARKIMESASQHDFLTGLPNRSKFMEDLEAAIEAKMPCTVMMIDIDDFKNINDTYGHTAGDDALKQLAARLKTMHSQILQAYRFAGDEFILIIRSEQSGLLEKTAYDCRQLFTKEFKLAGVNRRICGSIGIASYPKDTTSLEQLIVCADDAMYQVKKSGKNNFAFYSDIKKDNEEASL